MIFLRLFILLSLLIGDEWNQFISPDEQFSIEVPCTMVTKSKELLVELGQLSVINCSCAPENERPNFLYSLTYVDYPKGTIHKDSILLQSEIISESIDASILSLNGSLDYSSDISKSGRPGKIARVSYEKGMKVCKSNYYLVGDRFYALQVYSLKENSINENSERFLNSFSFSKH